MIDQRTKTDCLRCCIAMVLELPYEDVPDFVAEHGGEWPWEFANWAWQRGFESLWFRGLEDCEMMQSSPVPWRWIATGQSERGSNHAVVYCGNELEHDPHRSRAGLLEITGAVVVRRAPAASSLL